MNDEKKYSDKPNPDAKIGFVIFYPFQFYVFKNVYKHLVSDAEFIVDGGRHFPLPSPEGLIEDCVKVLTENNVSFRLLSYEDYKHQKYLVDFFSNYKVLIALWMSGCLVIPQSDKARKVHMNYGAGKELSMFGNKHRKWDLYLCLSQRVHKIIELFTWAEIVGYPKFDDWFNNELDEQYIKELKSALNPAKKTILYLPTHGDLSSIDELAGELKKINSTYNILIKLHYYAPYEEPDRVKKLENVGVRLPRNSSDLPPLIKVADVVLSDNSSGIFDAILADKPVVLADLLSEDYLNKGHKNVKSFRFRLPEGALTYSHSIEQRIKKDGSVVSLKKPEELSVAIKMALDDAGTFKNARKKLKEELFAFNDGRCGERAAAYIRKLAFLEKLPEKPILFHVFEAEHQTFVGYSNALSSGSSLHGKNLLNYYETRAIFKIKSLPFMQRIVFIMKEFLNLR